MQERKQRAVGSQVLPFTGLDFFHFDNQIDVKYGRCVVNNERARIDVVSVRKARPNPCGGLYTHHVPMFAQRLHSIRRERHPALGILYLARKTDKH